MLNCPQISSTMEGSKKHILIAGGTGFVGSALIQLLQKYGHNVYNLTRNKSKCDGKSSFFWNPETNEMDLPLSNKITHIINLCGAGVAEKRWTAGRKRELLESRTKPVDCFLAHIGEFTNLEHYITASGVNCYDFDQTEKTYHEEDAYSTDFLSQLVKKWEEKALSLESYCKVSCLRIGFVVSHRGGAIEKMEKPVRMGFGAALASGKQSIPWISLDDLCRLFDFIIHTGNAGIYNAICANTDNQTITRLLAKKWKKRILLPRIPSFVLQLLLGEMSLLVTKGVTVSNQKLRDTGFNFENEDLEALILTR